MSMYLGSSSREAGVCTWLHLQSMRGESHAESIWAPSLEQRDCFPGGLLMNMKEINRHVYGVLDKPMHSRNCLVKASCFKIRAYQTSPSWSSSEPGCVEKWPGCLFRRAQHLNDLNWEQCLQLQQHPPWSPATDCMLSTSFQEIFGSSELVFTSPPLCMCIQYELFIKSMPIKIGRAQIWKCCCH